MKASDPAFVPLIQSGLVEASLPIFTNLFSSTRSQPKPKTFNVCCSTNLVEISTPAISQQKKRLLIFGSTYVVV